MAEYIEREAVLKIIADNCPHDKCGYNTEEEMGAGAACYYIRKDVDNIPTADVVPKSEEGAECPTCYGTGRIGTTNWLTKNISKKQLAEEKAKAIAEHEQYIKTEIAREIFEEIDVLIDDWKHSRIQSIQFIAELAELKKKYTEGGGLNEIHALRTPASRY